MFCNSGASIIVGLHFIIIIESICIGLVFSETFDSFLQYAKYKPEDRNATGVIFLTFILIGIIGHLITVPFLCYSAQNHNGRCIVPYISWRILFSFLVIGIFIWQIICSEDKSEKISSNLSKKLLPLAIAQIPLGGLFSGISVKAYRYFVHEARVEIQNSLQNKHLIHY